MEDNIDLRDLWKKQIIIQPGAADLFSKLNNLKKLNLRKLVLTNILLIATCLSIVFIGYYYQPLLVTTKMGIILTVLAMVIYLFAYNQLYKFFMKIDINQSNNDYLQNLISIRTKQQFLWSTMLSLYFTMLSLGICLSIYEYTLKMATFWAIFAYALTLTWIGFIWFYRRPKTIKKQQDKLNEIISKYEDAQQQLQGR